MRLRDVVGCIWYLCLVPCSAETYNYVGWREFKLPLNNTRALTHEIDVEEHESSKHELGVLGPSNEWGCFAK